MTRQLDALIAERVMEWKYVRLAGPPWDYYGQEPDRGDTNYDVPHYSTDIAVAWQVVETLAAKQIYVSNLYLLLENVWVCEFHNRAHGKSDEWRACANTPMSAICRAAIMYATGMDALQVADMIRDAKHMEETK